MCVYIRSKLVSESIQCPVVLTVWVSGQGRLFKWDGRRKGMEAGLVGNEA